MAQFITFKFEGGEQLPVTHAEALTREFAANLEVVFGTKQAAVEAAATAIADCAYQPGKPIELPPGQFADAFRAAERAVWMMHRRPLGGRFSLAVLDTGPTH